MRLETRIDYDYEHFDDGRDPAAGISGKYLNLILNGSFNEHFSYAYRQRILPSTGNKSLFDGTDWLYLTYKINDRFSVAAGKQVFMEGGFEYDLAPIDVYFWSDYWNNVRCYQMGATLTYTDKSKHNSFVFQFANSNYSDATLSNLYAYNLVWYGNYEHWRTIYSVNMVEYRKGYFMNYIVLGNKFVFDDFSFYVDFMNRATDKQDNFLFDDYSLIGRADWRVRDNLNLFVKGGYDTNKSEPYMGSSAQNYRDIFVLPGVEYNYYGIGAEFYPLKGKQDIRLHGFVAVKNFSQEKALGAFEKNNRIHFNVGVTWRIDMLRGLKTIISKN